MLLELRNPEDARHHLLGGIWLSRVAAPVAATLPRVLECALALAGEGHPLPPLGFVADVALLAMGTHEAPPPSPVGELPGIPAGLVRQYEDYVLGKLYADLSFERAADAVLGYAEPDRSRAVAYLLERLQGKCACGGVLIGPAAIRGLLQLPPDQVLQEAWELSSHGLSVEAIRQYEAFIDAVRSTGNLLAPEDVFELEHGTALVEFGQRLALRQVLQAATLLNETLPRQKPRASSRRRHVATSLLDEDAYPVGGFSSISTKGTIESLLHSQLAYIEPDDRPDLFDIKYVRDELLYYSRDENQFLRRRSTLFVVLSPDLTAARIKDPALPFQRIVLALGLIVALFRKLSEWLSDEALELHIVLPTTGGKHPLPDEQALLELIFSEEIALGLARIEGLAQEKLPGVIASHARRSLVECLLIGVSESNFNSDQASAAQLLIADARPQLCSRHAPRDESRVLRAEREGHFPRESSSTSEEQGLDAWRGVLLALLERWL